MDERSLNRKLHEKGMDLKQKGTYEQNRKRLLEAIGRRGVFSAQQLKESTGLSLPTIRTHISALLKEKKLFKFGSSYMDIKFLTDMSVDEFKKGLAEGLVLTLQFLTENGYRKAAVALGKKIIGLKLV